MAKPINSALTTSTIQLTTYAHLGGRRGFSKVVWTVKEYVGGGSSPYITLYYRSFDGEKGTHIHKCTRFLPKPGAANGTPVHFDFQ
ncbi:hypothetical protein EJB05_37657, partial [Eragrostis curvula]